MNISRNYLGCLLELFLLLLLLALRESLLVARERHAVAAVDRGHCVRLVVVAVVHGLGVLVLEQEASLAAVLAPVELDPERTLVGVQLALLRVRMHLVDGVVPGRCEKCTT